MRYIIKQILYYVIIGMVVTLYNNTLVAQTPVVIRKKSIVKPKIRGEEPNTNKSVLTKTILYPTNEDTNYKNALWSRIIYREIPVDSADNGALVTPLVDGNNRINLFTLLLEGLYDKSIPIYAYTEGREVFDKSHLLNFDSFLSRFHFEGVKRSNKSSIPFFEAIDIDALPIGDIKAYYIKEIYYIDKVNDAFNRKVLAICPILYTINQAGNQLHYPLFWVKYGDIRPILRQYMVMNSNQDNVRDMSLSDFFDLHRYNGPIVKADNYLNKSMIELYPNPIKRHEAQQKVEQSLRKMQKSLQ